MDAGALRDERRLGSYFPVDHELCNCYAVPGYSVDDPQVIRAMDEFEKLGIEEADTFRMQPCVSPVWDTAYALFALGEAGVAASDPRMVRCADWLLQKQVRKAGDWKVKNPKGSRVGGISSSTMSSTPTWMTVHRFASR